MESLGIAIHSIPYSVYAAESRYGVISLILASTSSNIVILDWMGTVPSCLFDLLIIALQLVF